MKRNKIDGVKGEDTGTINSLNKAFNIIGYLDQNGQTGVTELAKVMDVPTSTAHIYLKTLEKNGYIVKKDRKYQLGFRFLQIGGGLRSRQKVYQVSKPVLKNLAKETDELADLLIEERGMGVLLYKAETENAVDDNAHIGQYIPLHCTAMGKAILSALPEWRVEEIIEAHGLPRHTSNTITSKSELFDELSTIREAEVSYNKEERTKGVRAVGSTILSTNDDLIGAISISGPTARMDEDRMEKRLTNKILEAKNIIELKISHH